MTSKFPVYCQFDPNPPCPVGWKHRLGSDGQPKYITIPGLTALQQVPPLGPAYCFGDLIATKVNRKRADCYIEYDTKYKTPCCRGDLDDKVRCDPKWKPGSVHCEPVRQPETGNNPGLVDQIGLIPPIRVGNPQPTSVRQARRRSPNRIARSRRFRQRETFTDNPGAWVGIGIGALVVVGGVGIWQYTKKK